jgi:hypothetical protein
LYGEQAGKAAAFERAVNEIERSEEVAVFLQLIENANFLKRQLSHAAKMLAEGFLEAEKTCWECGAVSKDHLQKCSQCCAARYCCRKCQVAAWKGGHDDKCSDLGTKYKSFQESLRAVDSAHETGEMHGLCLPDGADYRLLSFIYTGEEEVCLGEEEHRPPGPSVVIFYENLGRVVRGGWMFHQETEFSSSGPVDRPWTEDEGVLFMTIMFHLAYDYFALLEEKCGTMDPVTPKCFEEITAERFLWWYTHRAKCLSAVDRFRLRRQSKAETLDYFKRELHK